MCQSAVEPFIVNICVSDDEFNALWRLPILINPHHLVRATSIGSFVLLGAVMSHAQTSMKFAPAAFPPKQLLGGLHYISKRVVIQPRSSALRVG